MSDKSIKHRKITAGKLHLSIRAFNALARSDLLFKENGIYYPDLHGIEKHIIEVKRKREYVTNVGGIGPDTKKEIISWYKKYMLICRLVAYFPWLNNLFQVKGL